MTKTKIDIKTVTLILFPIMRYKLFAIPLLSALCCLSSQADLVKKNSSGYVFGATTWSTFDELKAAAEKNDAKAMYALGWAYDEGSGVLENDRTANKWYKKSLEGLLALANKGDVDAMLAVGDLYEEGDGIPKNKKTAAEWFQKAADAGSAEGLYQLAEAYEDGDGVPRDKAKARELYKKAIEKGHRKAAKELADMDDDD